MVTTTNNVQSAFSHFLNRVPGNLQVNDIFKGYSDAQLAKTLVNSDEYKSKGFTQKEFINDVFLFGLGRPASPGNIQGLSGLPKEVVIDTIFNSPERASVVASINSPKPPSIGGEGVHRLETVGNRIIDTKTGQEHVPNGINVLVPRDVSDADIENFARQGFNSIRISGISSGPDPIPLDGVERIIDKAASLGMSVQLSYRPGDFNGPINAGEVPYGENLAKAQAYLANVAQRFKNKPNVMINTWNEMGDSNPPGQKIIAEKALIKTIRDNGFKNPIIVDDNNWGGGNLNRPEGFVTDPSLMAQRAWELAQYDAQLLGNSDLNGNLIVSNHPYGAKSVAETVNAIRETQLQGVPVNIGEFSNFHQPTVIGAVKGALPQLDNSVGALFWAFDHSGEPQDKMNREIQDFSDYTRSTLTAPGFGRLNFSI